MQLNKKLLTSAMTTLLLLSIVAATAPAYAISAPTIYNAAGTTPIGTTPQTVGAKLNVTGTSAILFSVVNVYWDSTLSTSLLATTSADSTGAFTCFINVPATVNGTHNVIVVDSSGVPNYAVVYVAPKLSVAGFPVTVRGLSGDALTVTGTGFSAAKAVTLTFGSATVANVSITPAGGVTTNATGAFEATIIIPSVAPTDFGNFILNATDANGVNKTITVVVDYYVTVAPISGPAGITITIAGRIPANTAYSTAFSTAAAFSGTSDAQGRFSGPFVVPDLVVPSSTYPITVTWGVTNTKTTSPDFTATANPTITVTSTSVQAGAIVGISSVSPFSASATLTLTIGTTVVNSTALDARFGPTSVTGAFSEEFTVPSLAPGVYTLTVTDQYGASATLTGGLTILAAPATVIALRASSYMQGDSLSFNIYTTETSLGTIVVNIRDPSSLIQLSSNAWALTAPGADGGHYVQLQMQLDASSKRLALPADATTGTWNWTITYTPTSTNTMAKATGVFTVTAKTTLDAISTTLNQVNATVNANAAALTAIDAKLVSIDGKVATLSTSMGTVTTSVNALSASISTISNGVATINTKVGTIQTSLSSLDAVLGVVAGDTATLSTSLGAVTTSLASITPTLTSIQNGIATIETAVGTLQGTVTSINNGVVTVQTGVGTLQTSVGNLQPDVTAAKDNSAGVSSLLYVAIVLALVAAIAAIASIFLMRQKIAG